MFMQIHGWWLIGLLTTVQVAAGVRSMPPDSCQHPKPPVIVGTASAVCRSESVVLSATGCAGSIVWSTGEIGEQIRVQPQQTTVYTAICRARLGCISCFAEGWRVTVNAPNVPTVVSSATLVCPGDAVTLTVGNCSGTVRWLVRSETRSVTGPTWIDRPRQTTTYQATCVQDACVSAPSVAVSVQTARPDVPVIATDTPELCSGQTARLTASGCLGTVRWSDGETGSVRTVTPSYTTAYRAVCQVGSCRSDSATGVLIAVRSATQLPMRAKTLTNGCPFQTADLSTVIPVGESAVSLIDQYLFRTEPTLNSPVVPSPGAVTAGTYYIFGRDDDGCYTDPVAVVVNIQPCKNAIPPCLSNPAVSVARLGPVNWAKGVVELRGQMGGSATEANWQCSGDGQFADAGLNARYLLSEGDRQRGAATFTLTAPDPDGAGPCVGASSRVAVAAPAGPGGIIGLSKKAGEPVWVTEGTEYLIELTYQLDVANMGQNGLANVRVSDNLDKVFAAAGVGLRSAKVRVDSGLVVNPAYTGRGGDTTLASVGRMPVAAHGRVWLTVRLDVSRATTLTFLNQATAEGLDVDGLRSLDRSTEGTNADPDKNGTPTDNSDPTRVTLLSLQPGADEIIFIPEGFSPNNDGTNDRFVIQRVPAGIVIRLEVFNRWGNVVYVNNDYKNDWDGTANQGINVSGSNRNLPEGTYYYQVRLSDGRNFTRFLTLVR